MSINNLSLHRVNNGSELPFPLQDNERLLFRSATPRQSLAITSKDSKSPIKVHISVTSGYIFVTNRRFIYITESQGDVESFVFDFSSVSVAQFSHAVKSPWFGPNHWQFLFFNPEINSFDAFPKNEWFHGKVTFSDGGLFDFVSIMDCAINDSVNNLHIDEELPRYTAN